uniref:F-box family protein n=1 Tax=Solanum tuberosum TaxID=4113 RepID=M1A589_SOLTU
MQRKLMAGGDRLNDLPDSILLHILSMLPNNKEVVRTSVLSERWQFLWKFVPTSLEFNFPVSDNENDTRDYLVSIHRELYYWRSCEKIRKLRVWCLKYDECYAKDVDIWVYFATKLANVEDLQLGLSTNNRRYEFPQFAYKNASLRNLVLWNCQLNPFGNVNWSSLLSLSIVYMEFTDGVIEKFLSILELKGWEFPPSSRKFLELDVGFEQLDFPGICCFLQSSLDLETLVIDWYDVESGDLLSRYTNEDEQIRRFESHNFNGSFPYLKTIKILNLNGSVLPLVKYLLNHAIVLEKFDIVAAFQGSDASPNYVTMAQELLSYPISSPHASVVFSYR